MNKMKLITQRNPVYIFVKNTELYCLTCISDKSDRMLVTEIKNHANCVAAPTSETNLIESNSSIVTVTANVDPIYTTETGTSLIRYWFVVCLDTRQTLVLYSC